jgi:hypothetical protein
MAFMENNVSRSIGSLITTATNQHNDVNRVMVDISFMFGQFQTDLYEYYDMFPEECVSLLRRTLLQFRDYRLRSHDRYNLFETLIIPTILDHIEAMSASSSGVAYRV